MHFFKILMSIIGFSVSIARGAHGQEHAQQLALNNLFLIAHINQNPINQNIINLHSLQDPKDSRKNKKDIITQKKLEEKKIKNKKPVGLKKR